MAGHDQIIATDSTYAAARLVAALALTTVGACGMYIVPVVLPAVQAEFGIARAQAALPYSLMMICFGLGGLMMGRIADRFGVMVPLLIGGTGIGLGFAMASMTESFTAFMLAHGIFIGLFGSSAMFAPLIADTSLWWVRRRGMAVAICASGNYLGGTIWPPVIQHFIEQIGWRQTYLSAGIFCFVAATALALCMRRRPPVTAHVAGGSGVSLDLAVARGAAAYGRVRAGHGIRIRGGTSRAYYVGVEASMPAVPGLPTPVRAVCLAPMGMEEGTSAELPGDELGLVVGEPVEFRLFSSSVRREDGPGAVVEDAEELEEGPPVTATIAPGARPVGEVVPVRLRAHVTEIGTLELECVGRDESWSLEWNLRGQGSDAAEQLPES